MALRPVSDLGLVDLTDLAEPGKGKKAPAKRVAAPANPQQPAKAKSARPKAQTDPPARRAPKRRARTKAASAARTGMMVATWTAAGACGIVLGRAAVRR